MKKMPWGITKSSVIIVLVKRKENMREIHKKIDKKYFDEIASGQKTFVL